MMHEPGTGSGRCARPEPVTAAGSIVAERYPACTAAFLAGSVTGGMATPYSDLDLVIITEDPAAPYRESFTRLGWPVEAFVHSVESAQRYFASDAQARRPVLPRMVLEGVVLRDLAGTAEMVREMAAETLRAGPPALTAAELEEKRYFLTDLLEDLRGLTPDSGLQRWFVANEIASQAVNLILAARGQWSGTGKWLARMFAVHDHAAARALDSAMAAFAASGSTAQLIDFVEQALRTAGGPLFEGFRRAGRRPN